MAEPDMKGHAPGCTAISAFDSFADVGEPLPDGFDPERAKQVFFMRCVDGCPYLERAKAKGRELAERYGW